MLLLMLVLLLPVVGNVTINCDGHELDGVTDIYNRSYIIGYCMGINFANGLGNATASY
jgi:hypothetical protein